MATRDYYEILEITRSADDGEIKKSYRRLAMRYHPDRNPDDPSAEDRFKEINEAYEVLSDASKRQAYDRFGHAGVQGGSGPGGGFGGGFGGFGGGSAGFGDIFGDLFEQAFGGGVRGQDSGRGSDLRYELDLTLEEAALGKQVTIQIPSSAPCEVCHGTGAKPGSKVEDCSTCAGRGQVRMVQGFFSVTRPCPQCNGSGKTIKDPCSNCQGHGRVRKTRDLEVKVPAGVDTGDRIRLNGEGEAGERGAAAGDLYIQVRVQPHSLFERDGDDLHCAVPVTFTTMAMGGELEVPTLTGRAKIQIAPGTQSGMVFRLRGKGIKGVRSKLHGDLHCRLQVEVPVHLSARQKELLEEFASTAADQSQHPQQESWWNKAKDFLDRMGL
ncbi:molecular chaperone DnaJ [Acidithiobacillus thiooxidans]|uniref:Chaperone protein DnaJ n=1 Tax=Acidithiobacillus thiooxidans ATCC 19377 TaxID=637390 RepID=A0A5P9XVW0_ACITH|nr:MULTISPECIES: molecular chaperone DnaJ [Acidithiobacillus]MBU2740398.1 molecular chaperone DnaJ [Acidithiobacillus albertensis]MBU2834543.1 molecular chaperone DnaJ [Acidithiobacillus thiooxidans]MBU2841222.1 molecular chaperone DnaJ [Acidithiobacillus thiooxidans]MDA8175781.1 molecular chaperone DnaJ [Acidithiobacillus sp.]QFX97386.1 molecular chaperone DnaJ [Acidithiobacillus thiooxidans ATCC 19377]